MSQPVDYRIPPVELPFVHERYYPGVFGDFGRVIARHTAALEAGEQTPLTADKVRFYRFLLDTVDADAHRAIQDRYLTTPLPSGFLKYIDPVWWFEHKFAFTEKLGLRTCPPCRILDLGTGAGHFMKLAQFYGHEVVGTDQPPERREDGMILLFDELLDLDSLTRIDSVVTPDLDVEGLPEQVDLVTGFSVAFNRYPDGEFWTPAEWDAFLSSLARRVLKPGGQLYMTMMTKKLTDDVWSHLKSRAVSFDDRKRYILIEPT